jgi:hypothetical protein
MGSLLPIEPASSRYWKEREVVGVAILGLESLRVVAVGKVHISPSFFPKVSSLLKATGLRIPLDFMQFMSMGRGGAFIMQL